MTQPTTEIVEHYAKQIGGIVDGLLLKVLEENGLPKVPAGGHQLAIIPVYEETAKASLLTLANIRAPTRILWPTTSQPDFLQAYYRRYRGHGGRMCNDITVLTTNYCWARFYAAKELIHCFMDEDGHAASNSIELVNDLMESLAASGIAHPDCLPQTIVDQMAWYGAVVYLMPTDWLPVIRQLQVDLEEQFKDGSSFLYVAQILRVPELALRVRLRTSRGA